MNKRDRLILLAAESIGVKLTFSNNLGDWSRGEPYASNDKRFNPLSCIDDACEVAEKLSIDLELSRYAIKKAMLKVVCVAASYNSTGG